MSVRKLAAEICPGFPPRRARHFVQWSNVEIRVTHFVISADNPSRSDYSRVVDVVAGNGDCLHHGWVYSHPARARTRNCGDTAARWSSSRVKHRHEIAGSAEFSDHPAKSNDGGCKRKPASERRRDSAQPRDRAQPSRKGGHLFTQNVSKYWSRAVVLGFSIGVVCMMLSSTAAAQVWDKTTTVTFRAPVEIPRLVTVLARRHVRVRLLDALSDRMLSKSS